MSYYASLQFKVIPKEKVPEFLESLKEKYRDRENIKELLEDSHHSSPYGILSKYREFPEWVVDEAAYSYIESLLTTRFFYFDKWGVLIVLAKNYSFLKDSFDSYLYAQNSTDQDYEYETWDNISVFKEVSNKVRGLSKEEFIKYYNENHHSFGIEPEDVEGEYSSGSKLDYHKKSLIYDLIFSQIEDSVFDDKVGFYINFCPTGYESYSLVRLLKETVAKNAIEIAKEVNTNDKVKLVEDLYHPAIVKMANKILDGEEND